MRSLAILLIAIIVGIALILADSITGYAVVELCPQPSWVMINKPELVDANQSIIDSVNDFFNSTADSVQSFTKGFQTYYLASFINGPAIRECTTDLNITCGCQTVSYASS